MQIVSVLFSLENPEHEKIIKKSDRCFIIRKRKRYFIVWKSSALGNRKFNFIVRKPIVKKMARVNFR